MIENLKTINENKLKEMNESEIKAMILILEQINKTDYSSVDDLFKKIKEVDKLNLDNTETIDTWFKEFRELVKKVFEALKESDKNLTNFNNKSEIFGTLNFWYLNKDKKFKLKKFSSREGLMIIKQNLAKKNNINLKNIVSDIIFSSSIGFQIILRQVNQGETKDSFSLKAIRLQDRSELVFSKINRGMFVNSSIFDELYDPSQGITIHPNDNYYVYAKAKRRKGKHGLITIFRIFKN